jgi:hypothetical protein
MTMRRFSLLVFGLAAIGACGDDSTTPNPHSYQIVPPLTGSVSVRQDLQIDLRDSGLVIVRDGLDTLPGDPNDTTRNNPRLSYYVQDSDIAITTPYGRVRGIKPGTTQIRAVGYDQETIITVTVTPYRATSYRLSVASGPNGGLLTTKLDTGTFYALPADRLSSILEGLIMVDNDTVYCTRCGVKSAAQGGPRVMRMVNMRSLDPAKAIISNATTPFSQRLSGNTLINVDTVGRVTPFDTSSTPIGFVMEIPGDELADTAWVRFLLRPLDTLRVRPDSADFPPNTIDQIGTQRRIYPNSDTLQGNFTQSTNVNFAVGVDYIANVRRLPNAPSTSQQGITQLVVRSTGGVTNFRPNMPIISWESASPGYLQVNANGVSLANVIGQCAQVNATCLGPTSGNARAAQVLTCADNGAKLTSNGQLPLFAGDGTYSIPSCSPAKNITMPGAFCTTSSTTDLASSCTIWIRAKATDPASGKQLVDRYRINVRR